MQEHLLENIFQCLTLEKLIFYFKEKTLLNDKDLRPASSQSRVLQFSDTEIIRALLPDDLSSQMFGQGHMTLLAFVFALRHKLTVLNLLTHVSAQAYQIHQPHTIGHVDQKLRFDFVNLFEENADYLQPEFWGVENHLPQFGFSAVGCLFTFQKIGSCRAFDHYDCPLCPNETKHIFCDHHQKEIFWENDFSQEASTQAKMYRFYLDQLNFKEYDEEKLEKIINQFFYRYTNYKQNFYNQIKQKSPDNLSYLLSYYEFSSLTEMKQFGLEELRRRFLAKAKSCHPDVGGHQDLFREAREKYEILRGLL